MKRHNFTLIELMMVISVIGILVSILMPSLSKTRDKAKISVCGSNLKQMGAAGTLFAGKNNGRLTRFDDPPNYSWYKWPNTPKVLAFLSYYNINNSYRGGSSELWVGKYLRDNRSFYCPSDNYAKPRQSGEDNYSSDGFHKQSSVVLSSYSWNPHLLKTMGKLTSYRNDSGQPCDTYSYSPSQALMAMDRLNQSSGNANPISHKKLSSWNLLHLDGSVTVGRIGGYSEWLPDGSWATFDSYVDLLINQ